MTTSKDEENDLAMRGALVYMEKHCPDAVQKLQERGVLTDAARDFALLNVAISSLTVSAPRPEDVLLQPDEPDEDKRERLMRVLREYLQHDP